MALDIEFIWQKPLEIFARGTNNCNDCYAANTCKLTYCCDDEKLPEEQGIYVFCHKFGKKLTPLYIGRATNLSKRILQHFYNNVPLMNSIWEFGPGSRVLLIGLLQPKPHQKAEQSLKIAEDLLIKHALSEGNEIFNVSGTKTQYHSIEFRGNRESSNLFPKKMNRRAV